MMVREKKAASRKGDTPKPVAQSFTFPAPKRGWVLNDNLAVPAPEGARVLDNWVCTNTGIRARAGSSLYATLPTAATSLFSYKSGPVDRLFAATATAIYDITSVGDPLVTPAASVTGQTTGKYSVAQFGTPGTDSLLIANGTEAVRRFDGAAWTTPTITGVASANLQTVWTFASRVFFTERDTLTAWYLPVDSIAGAANSFSLAGIFGKGGSLLFGAKWSLDAGDGLDDKCVFVSTEGEIAVYEGTNPGSSADWRKAGVYQMPKPMGRNAFIQAGGDLLIATEVGMIPISAAIQSDLAAVETQAVSRNITPYWQTRAREIAGTEWEIIKVPAQNYMVVSQPDPVTPTCLVVNLQTGGWSRFTGWDTQCLEYYLGVGYYGGSAGGVFQMEVGGNDNENIYTAVFLGQYEGMQAYGRQKTVVQVRPTFRTGSPIAPYVSMQADYEDDIAPPPNSVSDYDTSEWDGAIWDAAIWDAETVDGLQSFWFPVGQSGYALAPELQLSFGVTPAPRVELIAIDAEFFTGAMVT